MTIPTRLIAGKWHRANTSGWQLITNALIVAILDQWPDATIVVRRSEDE